MVRKKRILLAVALVGVLVAAFVAIGPSRQPSFEGATLRRWLTRYAEGQMKDPESADTQQAVRAIRGIGDAGLPLLVKWMRYEETPWRNRLLQWAEQLPSTPGNWIATQVAEPIVRADLAGRAFYALGEQGSNAIPALLRLLTNGTAQTSMRATSALHAIGRPAVPPLLGLLADTRAPNRDLAVYALCDMTQIASEAKRATPVLLQCANDPDFNVAYNSLLALGTLDLDADAVVPVLTAKLKSADPDIVCRAVFSLAKYAERARPAVSQLTLLLTNQNPAIRGATTNTLQLVSPEALEPVPSQPP